jgi:hypothetical protein
MRCVSQHSSEVRNATCVLAVRLDDSREESSVAIRFDTRREELAWQVRHGRLKLHHDEPPSTGSTVASAVMTM